MMNHHTIAAIATPPGYGGIGIIRVSGDKVPAIAMRLLGHLPTPRLATYATFKNEKDESIDEGIAIYFAKPHSFTGEEVLELQGHGSPMALDQLLRRMLSLGAKMAEPGEFSKRAFLNNKIDLTQAEAIADLIASTSHQSARLAVRSLQGEFAKRIRALVESLIQLRLFIEAALDFPEEEIDFLSDGHVAKQLEAIVTNLKRLLEKATQGNQLRDGLKVVILGKPNAGKSTLLNRLTGYETAIVTQQPGTTRDVVREHIVVEGLPIQLLDTAGLRDSEDPIEQEGIRRACQECENADLVLILREATQTQDPNDNWLDSLSLASHAWVIHTKIDLTNQVAQWLPDQDKPEMYLSAKTGEGLPLLRQALLRYAGISEQPEGLIIARRRHLQALQHALDHLQHGLLQLTDNHAAELLADDLKQAQDALGEITGEVTSDELLGRIFSSFCIGK